MAPSLPSPQQKWSHCTNSFEELNAALENDEITAIEADVLIGSVEERPLEPIMAHPPKRTSNLSTQKFLEHTVLSTRVLRKHIKLDLKEMAVVPLTLALLRRRLRGHSASATNSVEVAQPDDGSTVFLNADIYPGPGARNVAIVVDADAFLEVCLEYLSVAPKVAFSLGFKVDYRAENEYYSEENDRYMTDLVHRYELHKKAGVVLALNARVLSRQPSAFDGFLGAFLESQILAWTGSGEPPISQTDIDQIQNHAQIAGWASRLGFDCIIEKKELRDDAGLRYKTRNCAERFTSCSLPRVGYIIAFRLVATSLA